MICYTVYCNDLGWRTLKLISISGILKVQRTVCPCQFWNIFLYKIETLQSILSLWKNEGTLGQCWNIKNCVHPRFWHLQFRGCHLGILTNFRPPILNSLDFFEDLECLYWDFSTCQQGIPYVTFPTDFQNTPRSRRPIGRWHRCTWRRPSSWTPHETGRCLQFIQF